MSDEFQVVMLGVMRPIFEEWLRSRGLGMVCIDQALERDETIKTIRQTIGALHSALRSGESLTEGLSCQVKDGLAALESISEDLPTYIITIPV